MSDMHRLDLLTFSGESAIRTEAIARARSLLLDWYGRQQLLFYSSGASAFQFSASLTYTPDGHYLYTITVVDLRSEENAR